MSIIHDALKKVQSQKNPDESGLTTPAQPSHIPVPGFPRWLVIAGGTAISLAVIIIFSILFGLAKETSPKPIPPVTASAPQTALPVPPAQVAPQAQTPKAQEPRPAPQPVSPAPVNTTLLRIEGVMDMGGGKRVALINGNIYEVGQVVQGKTITDITFDSVTITDGTDSKTLPLNK